ncbi:MAG: DUF427 domain-containing protein [Acidimicrobiia bacterium]|jgi:uncharacterized protein (DUF427 family)
MRPRPLPAGPGQESVWEYPRPPVAVADHRLVVVEFAGVEVARTSRAVRVLETSHPPGFYLPPDDVRLDLLFDEPGTSVCEWKGVARYHGIRAGGQIAHRAAWSYPEPRPGFESIAGFPAFYPGRVDRCLVDGVQVTPQAGGFYGGWITPDVVGPFKGEPGTTGW